MAKGTGLIGNFKGRVGNTVGYKLTASNNGQTQGIRVYQPIVKNPKTAAQAEQRAKLLAVNATYRALKMVIDRGNEGLPYGNKSRLAWLKGALKSTEMPWFEKGSVANSPVGSMISKGSLAGVEFHCSDDGVQIVCPSVTTGAAVDTVGKISTILKANYTQLKDGDQVTIAALAIVSGVLQSFVVSFIIDTTSTESIEGFDAQSGSIYYDNGLGNHAAVVILSRLGENGEHLRSTSSLSILPADLAEAPYDADSKAAAIASYQSSGYVNADWQEEAVQ